MTLIVKLISEVARLERRKTHKAGGLASAFTWLGGAGKAIAAIKPRQQPGDAAAAQAEGNPPFAPNAFIGIDAGGRVRLVMPTVEMGQSIYTGSTMLISEELGVELDQV